MNRLFLFLLIPALSAGVFCIDSAWAWDDSPGYGNRKSGDLSTEDDRKILLVRKMIRLKDFQRAADLLETVYEKFPDHNVVQNLLKSCYDELKQYGKAELLVRRVLDKHPRSLGHRLELAELLVKLGRIDEGISAYHEAGLLLGREDPKLHLLLIRSLVSSGLDNVALTHVDKVRRLTGDHCLFAMERGTILEGLRQYRQATAEFLPLLVEDSTESARKAEKKLMALLEFAESSVEVEEALVAIADSTAGMRTMRLLADHYIKAGRFDNAFAFALRQDSLGGQRGAPLLNFMRQCEERKSWDQVVRMAEYVLGQYAGTGIEEESGFRYAYALVQQGRPQEAILAYEHLWNCSHHAQSKADALYGIGVVHFDYLGDCSAALIYFDSLVNFYPRGLSYLNSLRSIPHCHLRTGKLKLAREKFAELVERKLNEDFKEEAAYFLAMIDFFEKKYDSAEMALRRLTVEYPRGYYVNDALRLIMLMSEAKGAETILYDLSNALLFEQREMLDSTRAKLVNIVESETQLLADFALFRLAELGLRRADSAAALTAIDRLILEFPDSYYMPFGMKMKADMLALTEAGFEEAKGLYRRLLEEYQNYPFATDVRERLRRLEADLPVG